MQLFVLLPGAALGWGIMAGLFYAVEAKQHPICECGYTVNATNASSPFELFTDLLETDFLHLYNLPDSIAAPASEAVGWAVQAYNTSPTAARGPYGKAAGLGNVILNPLPTREDWGGEGQLGGPPGLQMWVRGERNLLGDVGNQMIRTGEINSIRRDMRYGSFRVGMRMSQIAGTCAAFFWYRNDTQEIDMEYLSRQTNSTDGVSPINLVVQSPASKDANYDAANTNTFRVHPLSFMPSSGYHEYRFDWTPERIVFFADGVPLQEFENTFDGDAPNAPGTLMLNHWSNGNGGWSGGPPVQDAVLTLSYVKAYFNSSNATREDQWHAACTGKHDWRNRTCQIPEFPAKGIDPLKGAAVEETGKTFFFMYQDDCNVNQTTYPAATGEQGDQNIASSLMSVPKVWMILGWAVMLGLFALGG